MEWSNMLGMKPSVLDVLFPAFNHSTDDHSSILDLLMELKEAGVEELETATLERTVCPLIQAADRTGLSAKVATLAETARKDRTAPARSSMTPPPPAGQAATSPSSGKSGGGGGILGFFFPTGTKANEEADRRAKEEADRRAKEEAERRAKEEKDRREAANRLKEVLELVAAEEVVFRIAVHEDEAGEWAALESSLRAEQHNLLKFPRPWEPSPADEAHFLSVLEEFKRRGEGGVSDL
jgi:hypothetical protein